MDLIVGLVAAAASLVVIAVFAIIVKVAICSLAQFFGRDLGD